MSDRNVGWVVFEGPTEDVTPVDPCAMIQKDASRFWSLKAITQDLSEAHIPYPLGSVWGLAPQYVPSAIVDISVLHGYDDEDSCIQP